MTLEKQIKNDIKNNPIMLYMKGTKVMPMCGFSATVVNNLFNSSAIFKANIIFKVKIVINTILFNVSPIIFLRIRKLLCSLFSEVPLNENPSNINNYLV